MSLLSIPNVFSAGAVIIASQHNSNFSVIYSDYNGNVDNTNIATNAAIAYSKLNLTASILNADIGSGAAIVASKLVLTSPGAIGTVAPAAIKATTLEATTTFKLSTTNQGDILYDNGTSLVRLTPGTSGQFLKTQGAAANPLWATQASTVLATPQASTSGTSISFTGIPTGTKIIIISLVGVSTNGTSNIIVQIGNSGGIENTGYLGSSSKLSNATSTASFTTGFGVNISSATATMHGSIILTLVNPSAFTWSANGNISLSNAAESYTCSGSKSLSLELDRIVLTTVNGTDAFDAGVLNIAYGQ